MITKESQQAIMSLHERGVHIRQISQILKVSRNTVKRVIRGEWRDTPQRQSSYEEISDLVREVFALTKGNVVRVREILESNGHEVPYSTLTRIVRELELRDHKHPVRAPMSSAPERRCSTTPPPTR